MLAEVRIEGREDEDLRCSVSNGRDSSMPSSDFRVERKMQRGDEKERGSEGGSFCSRRWHQRTRMKGILREGKNGRKEALQLNQF